MCVGRDAKQADFSEEKFACREIRSGMVLGRAQGWGVGLPAASAAAATAAIAAAVAALALAAAAMSATAAAAAVTAATATAFARLGFVDAQVATLEILSVKALDCAHHGILGVHRDKRETTGAAGFPVRGQVDVGHLPVFAKQIAKIVFAATKGEVPHIHFHRFESGPRGPADCEAVPVFRVSDHHRILQLT